MDYRANIDGACWFAADVWPRIRARWPEAEFSIVGSHPTREVRALGRQPGITVTGFVDDVRPYLRAATLCVVPLLVARGVQNKVLEALAAGRAVVATPAAAAGLRAAAPICTAATASEFAAVIADLLKDADRRADLAQRGRQFVVAHHDWAPLLRDLLEQLEAVATQPTAQRQTSDARRREG